MHIIANDFLNFSFNAFQVETTEKLDPKICINSADILLQKFAHKKKKRKNDITVWKVIKIYFI